MIEREDQFESLSAYLDGELSPAEALDLESALAADADLRAELEALRETRALLQDLPAETAPDHFAREVLRRAERHHRIGLRSPGGALRRARWISMAAAAIVLLACGLAMIIISQLQQPIEQGPIAVDPGVMPAPGVLAADGEGTPMLAVVNEVIWTDDMAMTQAQVENLLADNRVDRMVATVPVSRASDIPVNVNQFQSRAVDPSQVEIVADVELTQVAKLRKNLADIRVSQRVVQGPVDVAEFESADSPTPEATSLPVADVTAEGGLPADGVFIDEADHSAADDLVAAPRTQRLVITLNRRIDPDMLRSRRAAGPRPAGNPSHR